MHPARSILFVTPFTLSKVSSPYLYISCFHFSSKELTPTVMVEEVSFWKVFLLLFQNGKSPGTVSSIHTKLYRRKNRGINLRIPKTVVPSLSMDVIFGIAPSLSHSKELKF